jgi:hypothetical protein
LASDGRDFDIGQMIGRLQEGLDTLKEEVGGLRSGFDGCQATCQGQFKEIEKQFIEIRQSLDEIKNPKISLRGIAHAIAKGAGYAGGAAVAFAAVYQLYLLFFH